MIWHLISVGSDERVGGDMMFDTRLHLAAQCKRYHVRIDGKGRRNLVTVKTLHEQL